MQVHKRAVAVAAVAMGTAGAVAAIPATSQAAGAGKGITVVARHLDDPFGLADARKHRGLLVAESTSGQVTRVFLGGHTRAILNGVPGVAGVAGGPSRVFAVTGGPNESGAPTGGDFGPSRVLRMNYHGGHAKVIANLLHYE